MAHGHPLFAALREFGDVSRDRIVELEPAAFPELADRDRRDRLGGRHPEHQVVPAHRLARASLAEGDIGDDRTA